MRIILISPNRLLHTQWNKAITSKQEVYSLYFEKDIKDFKFNSDDVILFDFDNLSELLPSILNLKVMCLSSKLNEINGFKLLKQGVKGYGNTYMSPMNLKEAINIINNNKIWIYPELMSFIINNSTLSSLPTHDEKINDLSTRELDVSKLVARGFTNKNIALELDITERTVKAHISGVFTKLEIKDRVTLGIMIKEYLN